MLKNFFTEKILEVFPYEPTSEQQAAIAVLTQFLTSPHAEEALLFKGYAGTGKTTLLAACVKSLEAAGQKTVLMAPTGRAAKVFAEYASHAAFTVHKKLYRQKKLSDAEAGFAIADNLHKDTVFIVDEASMLSNEATGAAVFGSGRLLDDLVRYVYSGDNCRLILSGDVAQLPPVGLVESPALSAACLQRYNLKITEIQLTHVLRQEETSGILLNATSIRQTLSHGITALYPQITTEGFKDIKKIGGDELIEEISSAYGRDGIDETMIICRSNKTANVYNNGIRNRILGREDEIAAGDRLMVVKNNYFGAKGADFIANGEIIRVMRVRRSEELYGFRFTNILALFPDDDTEKEIKLLPDVLHSEAPALTREQSDKLYQAVLEAYSESDRGKRIKEDPYYNAVQVKYAYAVTCHKAQGGQWRNVFLDVGYITEEMLGEEFYRWLYTAFTRATHRLFLVNWRLGAK